jgi:carboxymuconolactone decarboxylase family protein
MSSIYPLSTPEITRRRRDLAPNEQAAFEAFGKAVFADGALPVKTKQIIAVAVAHVTQNAGRTDGSDLGRLRDASRRRLCSFNADARYALGGGETSERFRPVSGCWSTLFEWLSGPQARRALLRLRGRMSHRKHIPRGRA